MITKPEDMDFSNRKIAMIVAGLPGIGKTTLALSAPKPLLVDLDNGVSRVDARYRADTLTCSSFEELKSELASADLSAYETIVLDTGGKLFELMKPAIIRESPKNGKQDGSLSLQGYGAAKRKYGEFISFVKKLGKNLVIVFHATEVPMDEQTTGLRIRIEGGTKDEIWDDMDLGCFMEMKGNKRTAGFSNCDRYYAKGTHSIQGVYNVPPLDGGKPNTFLTDLFKEYRDELNDESAEFAKYKKAMSLKIFIERASSIEALNQCYTKVRSTEHALTSKEELWFAITSKAKELGASYDKQANEFKAEGVADNAVPA